MEGMHTQHTHVDCYCVYNTDAAQPIFICTEHDSNGIKCNAKQANKRTNKQQINKQSNKQAQISLQRFVFLRSVQTYLHLTFSMGHGLS